MSKIISYMRGARKLTDESIERQIDECLEHIEAMINHHASMSDEELEKVDYAAWQNVDESSLWYHILIDEKQRREDLLSH